MQVSGWFPLIPDTTDGLFTFGIVNVGYGRQMEQGVQPDRGVDHRCPIQDVGRSVGHIRPVRGAEVDHCDLMAGSRQRIHDVRTDESCSASHTQAHPIPS
jgi:hypothetical protein